LIRIYLTLDAFIRVPRTGITRGGVSTGATFGVTPGAATGAVVKDMFTVEDGTGINELF
jgi:hypothetical protein